MKKLLSSFLLATFACFSFFPLEGAIAADAAASVVGFEIVAPATAKVNEAFDITVRAIDKNKETVKGYKGAIIFHKDTFGDVVPNESKSISFTQEDSGQKKFSKGVVFKSPGKQKITVVSVDAASSDLVGETTVMVEASASNGGGDASTETVTIVTPIKDSKITTDMVAVSGKTKKNSKVTILLNSKDAGTAVTDDSGLFTKTLSGIVQDKNIVQVNLLDGTNTIIAKSEEIIFEKAPTTTGFYNIVITPGTTVESGTKVSILVEGDAGMSSAAIGIDGSLIQLKENQSGKYMTEMTAPSKSGSYQIDVSMVSTLGQAIDKKNIAVLIVQDPIKVTRIPQFSNIQTVTEGKKIIFHFDVQDAPTDLAKFKIAYGENADNLSNEVMTYATGKIQGTGGTYTWYIDTLEPRTYTFKIFGVKSDNSLIPLLVSDPIISTIGKDTSTVANVSDIVVKSEAGKSILSWTPVTCALSYNVYKISPAGDYELVQNVKEPSYTVFFQTGSSLSEDFAIKALCAGGVESADFTQVSKVQTGPGATAILIIIAAILGAVILRRKSFS